MCEFKGQKSTGGGGSGNEATTLAQALKHFLIKMFSVVHCLGKSPGIFISVVHSTSVVIFKKEFDNVGVSLECDTVRMCFLIATCLECGILSYIRVAQTTNIIVRQDQYYWASGSEPT